MLFDLRRQPLRFAGSHLPWWSHVLGPLAFYAVNQVFVRLPQYAGAPLRRAALRAYGAFAFTTVFAGILIGSPVAGLRPIRALRF
jgi:hypothetical protein